MIKIIKEPLDCEASSIGQFVHSHPLGNYFQSPSLYHLYLKTSNYRPVFLISYGSANEINGVLLANIQNEEGGMARYLSSRCIVMGGPLTVNNDTSVAVELISRLVDECKGGPIYTEFRELFVDDSFVDVLKSAGFSSTEYYNYVVQIDGLDANRSRLSQTRRRQIGRALKKGATIMVADSPNHVREFYGILRSLYRSKVRKPLPPVELFENFLDDKESGKYFLVQHNGKTVGGIMCPIYGDTIYEWYVCGLDRECRDLHPSVLATWAPIEYAAANGLKRFDFMGAGRTDEEYGVREFKSKFGGELVSYNRFLKINRMFLYNIGRAGLKVYSYFK